MSHMENGTTRREFLTQLGLAGAGVALGPYSPTKKKERETPVRPVQPTPPRLTINGKTHERMLASTPIGARGIGEIGITGAAAAAVVNAAYNATGKRVRDLPVTIEKLIG